MAFVERGTVTSETWEAAGTVSVPLGLTTNAGDLIVLSVALTPSSTVTASGAGATWTVIENTTDSGSSTNDVLLIGSNCTAGNTSCSLVIGGTGNDGTVSGYVFSAGGAVTVASQTTTSSPAATSLSTSSVSWSSGNLVIGGASMRRPTGASSFSGSAIANSVNGTLSTSQNGWTGYTIAASSGSGVATAANADDHATAVSAAVLVAPSGVANSDLLSFF